MRRKRRWALRVTLSRRPKSVRLLVRLVHGSPYRTQLIGPVVLAQLIGAWLLDWLHKYHADHLGRNGIIRLVELGPGTGALMSDVLSARWSCKGRVSDCGTHVSSRQAVSIHASVAKQLHIHLVEASPRLQNVQSQRLCMGTSSAEHGQALVGAVHVPVHWHRSIDDVPADGA
jgi:SAM-dependent MidA family methyltransferase